jgi:hypothetical protein
LCGSDRLASTVKTLRTMLSEGATCGDKLRITASTNSGAQSRSFGDSSHHSSEKLKISRGREVAHREGDGLFKSCNRKSRRLANIPVAPQLPRQSLRLTSTGPGFWGLPGVIGERGHGGNEFMDQPACGPAQNPAATGSMIVIAKRPDCAHNGSARSVVVPPWRAPVLSLVLSCNFNVP